MPLPITKADEVIEVKNLCITIYSQPGLGKTSLAFTALNPLLLDFDHGAHRAVDRGDAVIVQSWDDVANITEGDLADYDTVIIDTVGKALDVLAADVIRSDRKYAYGGALNQQGWGQLGRRFQSYLKLLRSFGKDIVLIAHMDEKHDGDGVKERLQIPGGTKNVIHTDSDVMARISIVNKQRQLIFEPSADSYGKDPIGLGSLPLPDSAAASYKTCLGDMIGQIKEGLNELSEAQIARRSEVEWFMDHLPQMDTPDQINDVIGRAKAAGRDVSKMVIDRAKALGFTFDPDTREFVIMSDEAV